MTGRASHRQHLDYGLDAPGLIRFFLLAGAGTAGLALAAPMLMEPSFLRGFAVFTATLAASYLLGMGCLMLVWSKRIKVRERDGILDLVPWRGNERVLDVGCGRGLLLIGAAQRLTTGTAMGVDVWHAEDQSSNSPEATLANAASAGVEAKIAVQTADARALPFYDQSFDVVMSHWVVHNLPTQLDRDQALGDMVRVLRPGGNLIVADISYREAYLAQLQALGLSDCRMLYQPVRDAVLGALSFGSFRPAVIIGRLPLTPNKS